MARTTTQIDADILAVRSCSPGVRSVRYSDGRGVDFSTEEEKQAALARLNAERAGAVATTSSTIRRRKILFQSSKGL